MLFRSKITYDGIYRTLSDTTAADLTTTTEWDQLKDLVVATTDHTGMRSTIAYDYADRPTDQYGPAPAAWFPKGVLSTNSFMYPGGYLMSQDGRFSLALQSDGNLVVYGPSGPVWSSQTGGHAVTHLLMQSDCNLVLYNGATDYWASNTVGGSYCRTVIENTGQANIYNEAGLPVWKRPTAPVSTTANPSNAYRAPFSTYTNQTPRSQTTSDEGINTLAAAFYNEQPTTNTLVGTPKKNQTGINPADKGVYAIWGTNWPGYGIGQPITPDSGKGWGARVTGWVHLMQTGTYKWRAYTDDGFLLYIDDQLIVGDWRDTGYRQLTEGNYVNTADSWHRIRIEKYTAPSTLSDARLDLCVTRPDAYYDCANQN